MIRIVADSTCDLSPELKDKYGVAILPLFIRLGDEEYRDGENITPDEIYRWADAHHQTPKTAACDMETAKKLFREIAQAGDEAVCFAISGHMSTTVNAMRLAAEEAGAQDRVLVVDTQNLSTGGGLLVLAAADMARQGCSLPEIAEAVEELRGRVRASFVVDTLTYLHRGGRCSGVAALMGGALRLHPKIVVQEGRMQPEKKYRGRMSHVVMNYVRDMEESLRRADSARVFITHSGCDQALLDEVKAYLTGLGRFREILITRAGGVISSHCGPGTLGVLYVSGE
ncbi:MAG: DegV family protein [Clostridia bacterium]|nr:DegV family protein [Clostridia bacterium]